MVRRILLHKVLHKLHKKVSLKRIFFISSGALLAYVISTNFFTDFGAVLLGMLAVSPLTFGFFYPLLKKNGVGFCIWLTFFLGLMFGSFFFLGGGSPYFLLFLFVFGWSFKFKSLLLYFESIEKKSVKEWWIDIRREGNTPTPDDLQVGKKEIDDALFIYGEPHTWWEQRIKEPQALAVLHNLLNHQDGICSITGTDGLIQIKPPFLHNVISEWMHALSQNPPTPKDWKDSAADFSVPAIKKIATASQSGSPIAVPVLIDEKKNEEREAEGFDPFNLPPIYKRK